MAASGVSFWIVWIIFVDEMASSINSEIPDTILTHWKLIYVHFVQMICALSRNRLATNCYCSEKGKKNFFSEAFFVRIHIIIPMYARRRWSWFKRIRKWQRRALLHVTHIAHIALLAAIQCAYDVSENGNESIVVGGSDDCIVDDKFWIETFHSAACMPNLHCSHTDDDACTVFCIFFIFFGLSSKWLVVRATNSTIAWRTITTNIN